MFHLDEHFWHPGWLETRRAEWRALPRVVRRVRRGKGTDVQAYGCPARWDAEFLWWVLRYRRRSRPRVVRAIADLAPHAAVHVLRSPRGDRGVPGRVRES